MLVALLATSVPAAAATDLLEVFRLALDNDAEYLSAGSGNRAAQENRPQARALLLPDVRLGASTTGNSQDVRDPGAFARATGTERFNSRALTLSVTQPIYRKDLWIQLQQADTATLQANAGYAFARQALMLRVAERYFAVLQAIDELGFAVATRDAFGQQLKQSQQRFEVGLIAITDVEEAQAGFDLATAQVIEAENQVDTALEALREVTGAYPPALAPLDQDVPLVVPEPDDIEEWTRIALEQNLQLAAARLASEGARDEIKRVQAGHLPTLDLVGTHDRNRAGGGTSGSSRVWTSALSLQLNVPIYQGGLVVSQTRESRHLYQQSLDDLERQRRATHRQTRDAFLGVQSGISRVKALLQAVRSTQSAKEAIEAGFQVGTRTSVDVLNADRELFRARRDHAAARYEYILDTLRLKLASGILSEDDLAEVNGWLQ